MYSILISLDASLYDETIAALWEFGTLGLIEEPNGIRAFFESAEQTRAVSNAFERAVIENREEKPCDSEIKAGTDWEPILIGQRFFVAPARIDAITPPGRIRLTVDAQSAFGSGRHESTQLVLQALETCVQAGMTVLDVGCGSGIVGEAARLLGASRVLACDIDPNSIAVASRFGDLQLFAGSADAIRSATIDLVVANITARVVDALAPDLHRVVKPTGRIIISGFVSSQPPRRHKAERILEASEWECWICKRDAMLAQEHTVAEPHSLRWW
ncbi:MAG TPA: 50S ribosomal protein L11 methyltransferase [Bryobacteraceae bacterium]|nr:50S ribosomal protein L11 methyltransferase [Bryobacteraceae bacterium]